jgi:hypothetical protein
VAPGFVIILAYELAQVDIAAGVLRVFLVESLAYVLGWVAFPVLVHQICEAIGKRLPGDSGWLLRWVVSILILSYEWYITRTALAVTAMGAVGFVVLDFVVDLIIHMITMGMIR